MMLSWKQFKQKFSDKTTTNIDLYQIAKILKIKNFHVIMSDELGKLPTDKYLNVITNIHSSEKSGCHWNAFYKGKKGNYFFDSYGLMPTKEISRFLKSGEIS